MPKARPTGTIPTVAPSVRLIAPSLREPVFAPSCKLLDPQADPFARLNRRWDRAALDSGTDKCLTVDDDGHAYQPTIVSGPLDVAFDRGAPSVRFQSEPA